VRTKKTPDTWDRCPHCFVHTQVCICDKIPSLTPVVELLIIRHWKERLKPSNTARLAALAIPALRILDYGAPGTTWDPAAVDLTGAALLFPDPSAPVREMPKRVIVVDGSWAQARKLVNKIPGLRGLPQFEIQPPDIPRVRLRTPPHPGCVSTIEAIAAVLDKTEGPDAGAPLRALLDEAVQAATLIRGRPLHSG
jgi:DTW domain-containing protein YfiP